MAHAKKEKPQNPGSLTVSLQQKIFMGVCMFVGLIAFVLTLLNDPSRAWHAYLIGFFYFVTLSLGGFFFTAVNHVAKSGWIVNVRRISESLTAFLPIAFILGIGFLFGAHTLYEWLNPKIVAGDHLLQHKSGYLNQTFFIIRFVSFFAIWIFFAKKIVSRSLAQDKNPDDELTHKNVGTSVIAVLLFALTYSFFSVDTVMALEAHWFSTIFGVYAFSGMFQSTMAFMILILLPLIKSGKLKGFVDMNHIHDLGKYMFGFTVFWAYIAFSQFMLIWYANLPEETFFFVPRMQGGWVTVSLALIIFKFIVPFFALLPRWAKRTPSHLTMVSYLILIMQFVDLLWLVYPHYNEHHVTLGAPEILIFLGFLGVFLWSVTNFLSKHELVPVNDPRIDESLNHHVTY